MLDARIESSEDYALLGQEEPDFLDRVQLLPRDQRDEVSRLIEPIHFVR